MGAAAVLRGHLTLKPHQAVLHKAGCDRRLLLSDNGHRDCVAGSSASGHRWRAGTQSLLPPLPCAPGVTEMLTSTTRAGWDSLSFGHREEVSTLRGHSVLEESMDRFSSCKIFLALYIFTED